MMRTLSAGAAGEEMARSPEVSSSKVFLCNCPSIRYRQMAVDASPHDRGLKQAIGIFATYAGDRWAGATVPVAPLLRFSMPGGRNYRRGGPAHFDSPRASWNRRPCESPPLERDSGQPAVFFPRPLSAPVSLSGAHPP